MKERIAIIEGVRTPMDKAGGKLRDISADDLAVYAVKEVLIRSGIDREEIDEVILGNVVQPVNATNIARVVALKAGLPLHVPAFTVHRNCASGMEAITSAANRIIAGEAKIIIAGGTESMSNIPLLYNKKMMKFYNGLSKAKRFFDKVKILLTFRPSFLKPDVALTLALTDPISGLIMGLSAELLAREFHITRQKQDEYALMSHQRASAAKKAGLFEEEIVPVPIPPSFEEIVIEDRGPRENQKMEDLEKLSPSFDHLNGTVTAGNSCPISDGAAAVVLMSEKLAKKRGVKPLGYLTDYAYAALEPERKGLGPVYATAKLQKKTGIAMKDIELIEMNESFAAQVIANEIAFASAEFAKEHLNMDRPIGEIDRGRMNVNGGAIALGHPVGMTGTRLVIHLLRELRRRKKNTGLATLCVGGGQGAALLLEVE